MEHRGLLLLLGSMGLARVAAAAAPSPGLCITPGSASPQLFMLALPLPPEMHLDLFWALRCNQGMSLNHYA